MKNKFLHITAIVALFFGATQFTQAQCAIGAPSDDCDNDGIVNALDDDDDGDGVLDSEESVQVAQWEVTGSGPSFDMPNIAQATSNGEVFNMRMVSNDYQFQPFDDEKIVVYNHVQPRYAMFFDKPISNVRLFVGNLLQVFASTNKIGNFGIQLADNTIISNADFNVLEETDGIALESNDTEFLGKVTEGGIHYVIDPVRNGGNKQAYGVLEFPSTYNLTDANGVVAIAFDFIGTVDEGAFVALTSGLIVDTDSDNIPDHIDLDSDNDTVADGVDQARTDNLRAFFNNYPVGGQKATLAFEDLWPFQGDYDFNDTAVDYIIGYTTNGNNEVAYVNIYATVSNDGGSFKNGLGFELEGIAPSNIGIVQS